MQNSQKGISLVITFLIMAIMLAIVLGIGSILSGQIKIIGNAGDSISAFYAAESGIERTWYAFKKCPSCNLNHTETFDSRTYSVNVKISGGVLTGSSTGVYKDASRKIEFK